MVLTVPLTVKHSGARLNNYVQTINLYTFSDSQSLYGGDLLCNNHCLHHYICPCMGLQQGMWIFLFFPFLFYVS